MISSSGSSAHRWCPFVENPFEDCLCADMNSQKVEEAIYYCGGNYQECEIYARRMGAEEKSETFGRRSASGKNG
jgi:hypothetical protein